jgi:glycosyltransferase involved in cell wall biosynthesis
MGDDCTVIGSLFDLKFFDPDVQGVDPTSFRDELGVTDEKILLYPARITPGKGQMDFLKACVKLREAKGDTFRAVIVGPVCDEEYLNSQKEFISVNNLDKIARILPSVDRSRVRNMYAASYAVVCPSYTEALPLIPLESMSMKKPVLAYKDVPGIDEVVLPEKTGLLVKKGDPNAIAEGVIRLFDDPALASELGEFGRRLVAADYSPEMLARRYMSLYSELRKSRAATKRKIGWISPRVES